MIYKIEIVTFQKINYNEGINAGALFMFISEGRRKDKTKKREFKSNFTKHIKYTSFKNEIFLDEKIAKDINQLKSVCNIKQKHFLTEI